MNIDFGDYCLIEQKRYGVDNETYVYKVIRGGVSANYWRAVPVDSAAPHNERGDMCDVVKVIRCGVDETRVETFRLCDIRITEGEKAIARADNLAEKLGIEI
jgi:hypothetical protein